MKYQALFDLTMERGGATIRVDEYPARIVMPTKGYAVGATVGEFGRVSIHGVPATTAAIFDAIIEAALDDALVYGVEYIGTWVEDGDIVLDLVHVFANKEYAMGYAHCSQQDAIYDLFNDKTIAIKRKR